MAEERVDPPPPAGKSRLRTFLSRRLPVVSWLSGYTKEDGISDLIAGVTLGLTMIPQSIAYASLAGLTPQDGLNSCFVGSLVYAFFGTIKEVVIGPSSLMALLTYEYTSELNMDFVVLLCFLSGVVELIMGLLHLGFLVEFISAPVVSGFTTATSLIIVVSQMKGLTGLRFKSDGIVDTIVKLWQNADKVKLGDTLLGLSCILVLLCLRKLKDAKVKGSGLRRLFGLLATGRNAITVLITSTMAYHLQASGGALPFQTSRSAEASLPSFRLPPTSTTIGNKTYNFPEMVHELGAGYIIIPVISVLANVAIAKAFVNGAVDATQEMLALSLCNVLGSTVQAMPSTGAFTRSAVASASGIRTPVACIYSAALCLMALGFLGPYFRYIPKPTLSAVLIAAIIFLIDWKILKRLWKNSWLDLFTVAITLVSCMAIGVEIGLLIGVLVGLVNLIYKWTRPEITVEIRKGDAGDLVLVTPRIGLYFPTVDHLAERIQKAAMREGDCHRPLHVDCAAFVGTDYTVAKSIISLKSAFDKRGQQILFINVPRNCYKVWIGSGCKKECFEVLESTENGLIKSGENSLELTLIEEGKNKGSEEKNLLKNPVNDHIA